MDTTVVYDLSSTRIPGLERYQVLRVMQHF